MSNGYSQRTGLGRLETALGADQLLLVSLDGREGLSELFEFQLQAVAPADVEIDFDRLLGAAASVSIWNHPTEASKPARVIRGIISSVCELETDEEFTWYSLELVPSIWPLSRNRRCRIFESLPVPEILEQVLGSRADLSRLKAAPARNFCVQYDESDFEFALRLIEEEGYFFYFNASDVLGRMTVAEDSTLAEARSGFESIPFAAGGRQKRDGYLWSWKKTQELAPRSHTLRDWAFQGPDMRLSKESNLAGTVTVGTVAHSLRHDATSDVNVYEYPGRFVKQFDAIGLDGGDESSSEFSDHVHQRMSAYGPRRAQELSSGSVRVEGASNCGGLAPGYTFELTGHAKGSGSYVVTSVRHSLRAGHFRSDSEAAATLYRNELTAIPKSLHFRTPRSTQRPMIHGHQTATVVGADGSMAHGSDDICTDKYGRVRVRFHWSEDEANSCWLRVAQGWAGNQWGTVIIPRVGHEVVVGFEHGDPDCPLVYGSVYNYNNQPPHELPKYKTRTALMSCTNGASASSSGSGSGGAPGSGSGGSSDGRDDTSDDTSDDSTDDSDDNYNSYSGLAFGDTSGDEYLHLHAGGDMLIDSNANQYFVVQDEQATFIDTSQLTVLGGMRGIAIDFLCIDLTWQILSDFSISFADDVWSPVELRMDYFKASRIDANYGSEVILVGSQLKYSGNAHDSCSSVFAFVCNVMDLTSISFLSKLTSVVEYTGCTVGKVDLVGGDRYVNTSRRHFEKRGSQSYVYTGDVSTIIKYLWYAYSLLSVAVNVIVGMCDVRYDKIWREVIDILEKILHYGGNILAAYEIKLVAAKKIETYAALCVDLGKITTAIAADASTAGVDSLDHSLLLTAAAVVDAAEILTVPTASAGASVESTSGTRDLYHYADNNFVIDTAGSVHINAAKHLFAKASKQIALHGNTLVGYADDQLVLQVGEAKLVMSTTGITLSYAEVNYLTIDSTGVSTQGAEVNLTATGALNVASGTEASISASTSMTILVPVQDYDA